MIELRGGVCNVKTGKETAGGMAEYFMDRVCSQYPAVYLGYQPQLDCLGYTDFGRLFTPSLADGADHDL